MLMDSLRSGYNPPQFIIDAAKSALDRVECNQYSPTKGRPRLKKAIADAYTPFFGRKLDPETEVTITTGANEGGFCVASFKKRWAGTMELTLDSSFFPDA